jgi:hypothetical protein
MNQHLFTPILTVAMLLLTLSIAVCADNEPVEPRFSGGAFDGWTYGDMETPLGLGGAWIKLISADNQSFNWTNQTASLLPFTIRTEEPQGVISNSSLIRIGIPSLWQCRFDTTALPVVSGATAVKTGTAAYSADGRWLEITVTTDFVEDDEFTVSDLYLSNLPLCLPGTQRFELEFDGDEITDAFDDQTVTLVALHTGGKGDGWAIADTTKYLDIWRPKGTVMLLR